MCMPIRSINESIMSKIYMSVTLLMAATRTLNLAHDQPKFHPSLFSLSYLHI